MEAVVSALMGDLSDLQGTQTRTHRSRRRRHHHGRLILEQIFYARAEFFIYKSESKCTISFLLVTYTASL